MAVDAIWDWLVSIPATIWGSVLVGLLTLLGVVIGQFSIYRREQRKKDEEIEALREALAVELRAMDNWLEKLLYSAHDMEKFTEKNYALSEEQYENTFNAELQAQLLVFLNILGKTPISKEVYESNADQIGNLDSDTAKSIIRTYRKASILNQSLQELRDAISSEEIITNSEIDWSTGEGLNAAVYFQKEQIKPEVISAVINQKFSLYLLDQTLTERDHAAFAFAFSNQTPLSQDHERLQQFLHQYMEKHDLSFEELAKGDHPEAQEKS